MATLNEFEIAILGSHGAGPGKIAFLSPLARPAPQPAEDK